MPNSRPAYLAGGSLMRKYAVATMATSARTPTTRIAILSIEPPDFLAYPSTQPSLPGPLRPGGEQEGGRPCQ